jgi:tellurite resistance protein TerA
MTFIRGQKAKLQELASDTSTLEVAVELVFPAGTSTADIGCFGLDAAGRLADERYFIFYNQPAAPCGSVRLAAAGTFRITLASLPPSVQRLVFTAAIDGHASLGQIQRGSVRLISGGTSLVEFPLNPTDYGPEKAVMLAELYLRDNWRFAAIGQGFSGGLDALLRHFGGEVAEDNKTAAKAPIIPPPLPAETPRPSISKVTLTKPEQRHRLTLEKGPAAPRSLTVKAVWVDNGDASSSNDDLDLRVGILLPDGRMKIIQAPKQAGSFDRDPWVVHTGDLTSASAKAPATETVEVNPAIAQNCGGRVALVFSVYSAVGNGVVSVASMRPKMRMEYGAQVVECQFDFAKHPGLTHESTSMELMTCTFDYTP